MYVTIQLRCMLLAFVPLPFIQRGMNHHEYDYRILVERNGLSYQSNVVDMISDKYTYFVVILVVESITRRGIYATAK